MMDKRFYKIVILLVLLLVGCHSKTNELEEKSTLNASNKLENVKEEEQDHISQNNTSNNKDLSSSKVQGENNIASDTDEEIDNNKVQINGDYVAVDCLKEYNEPNTMIKMIGETDDEIILFSNFYSNDKMNRLITINPSTYQIIKELELDVNYGEINLVKYHDNEIVVLKDDIISTYNDDLELIRQILLPELIHQKSLPNVLTTLRQENECLSLIMGFSMIMIYQVIIAVLFMQMKKV